MEIKKDTMDKKNLNFYKNKKVVVTGATGFKGAWLCLWLKILGAKVYGIGFSPNKNKKLFYSLKLNKKINTKIIDIRNYNKLSKHLKKVNPDIIFHMAAQPIIHDGYVKPYDTYTINSIGTLNILEIARKLKSIKSIVCVTSDKCYQDKFSSVGFLEEDKLGGEDPYSGSKASAEIIINTYIKSFFHKTSIGVASARAGNVIGGGDFSKDRLVPDSIKFLIAKKTIFLRNPKFNRPWQHVLEPLSGYLKLGKKIYENPKMYSGAYNFGPKKNTLTNVENVVKKIIKYWGYGSYKKDKKIKYYEQKNLQLDIKKVKEKINWSPKLSIDKSIKITIEWYKKVLIDRKLPVEITEDQILEYME
tara:strand:- start:90 stop:1169 length:1080 start_codon:yes stop_codon:yes gene_type:complete